MALGGEDCGQIQKEKRKNVRLWSREKTLRRKMNNVGEGSRLQTDLQRKEKREGIWDGEIP